MAYANDNPKILFLDIETKPALIYSFGIRDQHIQHTQIKEDGGTICVGLKWDGERQVRVFSTWEHGYRPMLEAVHVALTEADAVCTYNGAKFDIPKLMGDFLVAGMLPPPPPTQLDIYLAVRKLGFICNKLAYVAPKLGLGEKLKHEGLQMWIDVMAGDRRAQRKMAKYCAQDVRLLEEVYERVKPYVFNHPHLGFTGPLQCPACGSHRTQSRGVRRTKASFITRCQCQACGSWFDGKRKAA